MLALSGLPLVTLTESTAPTVSTFVTNLGTFIAGLMDWAGDVIEFIQGNAYLEVAVFLVPLCGIGIAAIRRLIRL